MSGSYPKVFVSHASEDKKRFVEDFSKKLRTHGIDAWLDKWEMNSGDSLVDKIFEEGIKNAQAVVVVLSKHSINKPWVREEINASFVKRINTGSKLIPVLIDECEVPVCLQSTLYTTINDLNSYEQELERIVMAILGQYERPPLGELPVYSGSKLSIPGLSKIDGQILISACQVTVQNNDFYIQQDGMKKIAAELQISEDTLQESLEVLDRSGYIDGNRSLGSKGIHAFKVNSTGMETYLDSCVENYGDIQKEVGLQIVNHGLQDSQAIAEKIGQPSRIIIHIFDMFSAYGFIKELRWQLNKKIFYITTPMLKRWLAEQGC